MALLIDRHARVLGPGQVVDARPLRALPAPRRGLPGDAGRVPGLPRRRGPQVTRCGSQECGWGSWTTPAAAHEPVGVYRNPWFMTYANAEKRWKHADE